MNESGGMTLFHVENVETKATRYMYDAEHKGKRKTWTVYADSIAEAEETAKTICNLLNAIYLGNMTGGAVCSV